MATATNKTKTTKTTTSKPASAKIKTAGSNTKTDNKEFHKFLVDEIKDIYWAEKALVKALAKLKKASTSVELVAAFEKHAAETQTHVQTLEKVFELLGEKPVAKKCDAMQGLIEEAGSIIEDTEPGSMIRDAGLILAAQKVEHYEIATYGTLRVFADGMGYSDVEKLLSQTLENEKATDVALTEIAEGAVNERAIEE